MVAHHCLAWYLGEMSIVKMSTYTNMLKSMSAGGDVLPLAQGRRQQQGQGIRGGLRWSSLQLMSLL